MFSVIVGLRILGQKRVGFLAGRFVRPEPTLSPSATTDTEEGGEGIKVDELLIEEEERAVPDPDSDASTEDEEWEDARSMKKFYLRVNIVRALFGFSGILVLVSAGMFFGKGVTAFYESLVDVGEGLDVRRKESLGRQYIYVSSTLSSQPVQIIQPFAALNCF